MKKILFILAICAGLTATAQDVAYSQFHLQPVYLNPAMTGFFEGDVRFAAIFRDQWFTLGSPYGGTKYITEGGSVDGRINVGQRKEDYVGVGGAVVRDRAGDQGFTTSHGMFNLAYSKSFGSRTKHAIALGLGLELMAKQFRNGGAVFPSGTVENIGKSSIRIDVSAGLRYHVVFDRRFNMYVGFAYMHITQPKENFLDINNYKLYSKYVAHGGLEIATNEHFNLLPSVMVTVQEASVNATVGVNAKYIFGDAYSSKNAFSFGANVRMGGREGADAFIPDVRLDLYNVTLGVAYDVNISNLSRGTNTVGAIEVAAVYIFKRKLGRVPTNTTCPGW
jgi:type IX secretion system PorP/SprF family membrane protein